jgi:uncharacterized delta-60 repeat protein
MIRASHLLSRRHRSTPIGAAAPLVEPVERRTLMSAGAFDPTFGTAGLIPESGFALAVDAQGRTLISGIYTDKSGFHGTLTRYLPNGSVDPSFGTNGTAAVDGSATQIVPLANGNILVCDGGNPEPGGTVQELTSSGQLDTSFGTGGTVSVLYDNEYAAFYTVALGPNGTIYGADSNNQTIDRLTANGQLDPTFGTGGIASLNAAFPIANNTDPLAASKDTVAVDAAGQPVVQVLAFDPTTSLTELAFARFTTGGKLDTAFGTGGRVVTSVSTTGFIPTSPVVGPDGTLYAAGTTGTAAVLLAISTDGKTVTVADVPGLAGQNAAIYGIYALTLDAADQPVVLLTSGSSPSSPASPVSSVARFNPFKVGGTLSFDPTFAASGQVTLPGVDEDPSQLSLDPVGRIVVGAGGTGTARILTSGPSSVTPVVATGTVIGSPGSYLNEGNTAAKAFDGNLSTFYDAAHTSGDWTGLDLGTAAKPIVQIQYAPRAGWAARMVGGQFQVSSTPDFSSDVQTIYTVTAVPPVGTFTTVAVGDVPADRYVRYIGPDGGSCNVAEIRFLVAGPTQLAGTPIGTPGSWSNQGNTFLNALDGNLNTFYDAYAYSGDWVGLDLGAAEAVTQVRFAPRAGFAGRMVGGEIQASNSADFSSGVVTAYTITSPPPVGTLTTVTLPSLGAYRYWRYLGPAGGECNIAELEFDG